MKMFDLIKMYFPLSRKFFLNEFRKKMELSQIEQRALYEKIEFNHSENKTLLLNNYHALVDDIHKLDAEIQNLTLISNVYKESLQKLVDEANTTQSYLKADLNSQKNILNQILNLVRSNRRYSEELVWADIFHDASKGSDWLTESNFTPGRWAIGYQALYVLYRILNEIKPVSILELGLGQSTKMISQYAERTAHVSHKVVEHDANWVENYKEYHFLSSKTQILLKGLGETELNGVCAIRNYQNFSKNIMPDQYDLIVIDGPWGGDMNEYARIDIAQIMPSCLKSSFIILMDDYNRQGEQKTLEYMKHILDENAIEYVYAKYEGAKDLAVIASKDLAWACTF